MIGPGRWLAATLGGVALVTSALAAPSAAAPITTAAPPDAFYDLPADLADHRPGEILRSRAVRLRDADRLPGPVDTWQLLYRSTGMSGEPSAAVTTLIVPADTTGPRPLLSYQVATDATRRICAPSYDLVHEPPAELGDSPVDAPSPDPLFIAAGLAQGWAVAVPDHGGIDDRFLTPRQPGWAVLDGIRAAEGFTPAGLAGPATPVALWGYSGGAVAGSWAAEEQPGYAPELNLVGAVLGAPVRDLVAALRSVDGALLGGLIPLGLSAIGKDSAEFARAVAGYSTPDGRARIAAAADRCAGPNLLANLWYRADQLLTVPIDRALADPTIARELAARGISGRAPTAPVYLFNGVHEEVAPIAATDRLADSYCRGGTPVTYRREEFPPGLPPPVFTTHGVVYATGTPAAFDWLKQRLTPGAAPLAGCDIRTVSSSLVQPR